MFNITSKKVSNCFDIFNDASPTSSVDYGIQNVLICYFACIIISLYYWVNMSNIKYEIMQMSGFSFTSAIG